MMDISSVTFIIKQQRAFFTYILKHFFEEDGLLEIEFLGERVSRFKMF